MVIYLKVFDEVKKYEDNYYSRYSFFFKCIYFYGFLAMAVYYCATKVSKDSCEILTEYV